MPVRAYFALDGLEDVMQELTRLGNAADGVGKQMLQAGGEKAVKAWKTAAEAHGHRLTGDMIDSITMSAPTFSGGTGSVTIYPKGTDRTGTRNAEKAFILHYGKKGLAGSHWVDDADMVTEETAIPAMREIWENRTEGG